MTQQYSGFNQMGGNGGHVNPNDLNMGGTYNGGFENNSSSGFGGGGYASGSGAFQDDELAETLASPSDGPSGLPGSDFPMDMSGMNMGYSAAGFNQNGMAMVQPNMNGYSSTPDGDPIQSPYMQGFAGHGIGQMNNAFGQLRASSYGASPSARISQNMQRKPSNTRSPLTKNGMMNGLPIGTGDSFPQPALIRTAPNGTGHEKSLSGNQYFQNPTPNSISSFPGSGFSSPVGPHAFRDAAHLNDMLIKQQAASVPTKLTTATSMTTSQEAKRRKRRESHNQVERRRRDNINERIQDLSKLVPGHRLEDEKIKKMIANGTPLSPTLEAISSPTATSGLAGPGARRATGSGATAGNITTGLPIEDKDKGPNKGDILNGAVAWMRDLMWLNRLLISHNEDMAEQLGHRPYEVTNEEERMTAELLHALSRADETGEMGHFAYSRANGTGLRVPDFTDYKGEALDGTGLPIVRGGAAPMLQSVSPDGDGLGGMASEFLDQEAVWDGDEMELKEEDEFMDLR